MNTEQNIYEIEIRHPVIRDGIVIKAIIDKYSAQELIGIVHSLNDNLWETI